ncbi:hypothetical protein D8B26_008385 [Coccidioides posadasii str. Silveira]|uniref:uncharacterized protein n=1 Tax=Coccidioides posadasii (strain RMSCC 757 / Silveira) TaxID=443226 RepID=UPI001BEE58B8|nr:hypothetical protein D8B26_008385 [Coccidioides posadasii str. Silveira]
MLNASEEAQYIKSSDDNNDLLCGLLVCAGLPTILNEELLHDALNNCVKTSELIKMSEEFLQSRHEHLSVPLAIQPKKSKSIKGSITAPNPASDSSDGRNKVGNGETSNLQWSCLRHNHLQSNVKHGHARESQLKEAGNTQRPPVNKRKRLFSAQP